MGGKRGGDFGSLSLSERRKIEKRTMGMNERMDGFYASRKYQLVLFFSLSGSVSVRYLMYTYILE